MPAQDDFDLERRLREERQEAPDEFVHGLASGLRRPKYPTARPRVTLAFALSIALLVSLGAFGGFAAASSALHSSAASVRSALGHNDNSRGGRGTDNNNDGNGSPSHKQYHQKVTICYPKTHIVITYKTITVYKWVWKWETQRHHGHKVRVQVPVLIKVRVRTKVTEYVTKFVPQSEVPGLASKGAVFPVPSGGCSSLNPAV